MALTTCWWGWGPSPPPGGQYHVNLRGKPSKFASILQYLFQKIKQAAVAEWFKALDAGDNWVTFRALNAVRIKI